MMKTESGSTIRRVLQWLGTPVVLVLFYVLSSGPMLGMAFRLREATGWDGFYGVMWLYYPLIVMGHGNPVDAYIEWWVVSAFRTVGPG